MKKLFASLFLVGATYAASSVGSSSCSVDVSVAARNSAPWSNGGANSKTFRIYDIVVKNKGTCTLKDLGVDLKVPGCDPIGTSGGSSWNLQGTTETTLIVGFGNNLAPGATFVNAGFIASCPFSQAPSPTIKVFGATCDSSCAGSPPGDLVSAMNTNKLMDHLRALQGIANNHNGNRAAGTSGYNASIDYVISEINKHSNLFDVEVQHFVYSSITQLSTPTLSIEPLGVDLPYKKELGLIGEYSGTFSVNNSATTIVPNLGCYEEDYADWKGQGTVAIIKRGDCLFVDKVKLAAEHGAIAAIIFNDGANPERFSFFFGTISSADALIPSFGISYYFGLLLSSVKLNVSIHQESLATDITISNVLATTKKGRADRVIVVGSHLDSVPEGPGINDNGSGSSLGLELAHAVATASFQDRLVNKIRFAWWGGEELGLLGSIYYVENLNDTDIEALNSIQANLDTDMIASPNPIRLVYNGVEDLYTNGSAVIQRLYEDFFAARNLSIDVTPFDGRSDYVAFSEHLIPAGGLFSGAEEIKTPEERHIYGGLASSAYDPCYHQACDDIENVNEQVFLELSQATASVLQTLSTSNDVYTLLNP